MSIEIATLSHIVNKTLAYFENKFVANIIARWSKYRAQQFFLALICEMKKRIKHDSQDDFDAMLIAALESEEKSETLFESYRKVVLSASKELGPRMIGLLTAILIAEDRVASQAEEIIAMVAESFTDSELRDFLRFYQNNILDIKNAKNIVVTESYFKINLFADSQDLSSRSSKLDSGSINFSTHFGTWAQKLRNLGIMDEAIEEEYINFEGDSESHHLGKINERKITWWAIVQKEYLALPKLIEEATHLTV